MIFKFMTQHEKNRVVFNQHSVSLCHELLQCCTAKSRDNPPASHCHKLALLLLVPCGHYVNGTCARSVTLWSFCVINHSPNTSVACVSLLWSRTAQLLLEITMSSMQGLDTMPATPVQSNAIRCCGSAIHASNPFEDTVPLLLRLSQRCCRVAID